MDTEDQSSDTSGIEMDFSSPSKGQESKTALIPIDFFQGKDVQPGSECKIKVSRVLDGQAEVTYMSNDQEPDIDEIPEQSGDDEMAGYMTT